MATTHLPDRNIINPFLSSYDSGGNPAPAALPDGFTQRLPGTGTDVNILTLSPDGVAITDLITAFSKTGNSSPTQDEGIALDVARPLGGSGMAALTGLWAVEVLLIADTQTTAEIEAGSTESRNATVTVEVKTAASGGATVFLATLSTGGLNQSARASFKATTGLTSTATLVVSSATWARKVKLYILTVGDND